MTVTARLVATFAAPLPPASSDAPQILHRLVMQRGDAEVVVRHLDGDDSLIRFPAPWPRRYGSVTVSPRADVAVFAGVHALRAVDPAGATLWELRHGCWSAAVCTLEHQSFAEYAADDDHGWADSGSAAFSMDGKLLWAHIREEGGERWLVLDPADGTVLARAETATVGSRSWHLPHPDPAFMGLTVAEGHEESPALWGRWDGTELTVHRLDEEVLLAVSPSGKHFLATDPGQWSLYLRRSHNVAEVLTLSGGEGEDRFRWDYEAAFPHDDAIVAGTEHDPRAHWLIDPHTMTARGRIDYPITVSGSPTAAGEGAWATVSEDGGTLHLWTV